MAVPRRPTVAPWAPFGLALRHAAAMRVDPTGPWSAYRDRDGAQRMAGSGHLAPPDRGEPVSMPQDRPLIDLEGPLTGRRRPCRLLMVWLAAFVALAVPFAIGSHPSVAC